MSQEFDIIVFGASGFTGRLVAEYLAATYPVKMISQQVAKVKSGDE